MGEVEGGHILITPRERLEHRLRPPHIHLQLFETLRERDQPIQRLFSLLRMAICPKREEPKAAFARRGGAAERPTSLALTQPLQIAISHSERKRRLLREPRETLLLPYEILSEYGVEGAVFEGGGAGGICTRA